MKKTIRFLCILLTLVVFCLSFSGCATIDKMRKEQAFWGKNNTVIYMDKEYKLLPSSEYLYPQYNEYKIVSVTDSDVPVLLCFIFGEQFDLSDDEKFIYRGVSSSGPDSCYCRTDIYDEVLKKIEDGFATEIYCYEYYDYKNEDEKIRILSAEEISTIKGIKEAVTPTPMPDAASLDYKYMVSIEECTSDLLFRNYVYDLCVANDKYYLAEYKDDKTFLYTVPEEQSQTIAKIMKEQIDSESYLYDFEDEF
ncbi:MAG: hypothetical protein J6D52_04945 [Clostridia bacterium]|nr:hypothetical protein [Clostridia bacterium]